MASLYLARLRALGVTDVPKRLLYALYFARWRNVETIAAWVPCDPALVRLVGAWVR